MWLYLALISAVFTGFAPIAMKKCSRQNDAKSLALLGVVTSYIVYILISILTTDVIRDFNVMNLVKIFPLTFTQMIGYACAISSVKFAKVTSIAGIRKANTVVTLILGIIVLNEKLTYLQIILSVVLIILTILIASQKDEGSKANEGKGIMFAFLFVLFNGVSSFLNKIYIASYGDPLTVVFYYSLVGIIFVLAYCIITGSFKNLNIMRINAKWFFLLHSALDLVANLASRFSLIDGKVSIVSVITSSSIIITVLASRIIIKEKVSLKKYLMILGIFICVLGLAYLK